MLFLRNEDRSEKQHKACFRFLGLLREGRRPDQLLGNTGLTGISRAKLANLSKSVLQVSHSQDACEASKQNITRDTEILKNLPVTRGEGGGDNRGMGF